MTAPEASAPRRERFSSGVSGTEPVRMEQAVRLCGLPEGSGTGGTAFARFGQGARFVVRTEESVGSAREAGRAPAGTSAAARGDPDEGAAPGGSGGGEAEEGAAEPAAAQGGRGPPEAAAAGDRLHAQGRRPRERAPPPASKETVPRDGGAGRAEAPGAGAGEPGAAVEEPPDESPGAGRTFLAGDGGERSEERTSCGASAAGDAPGRGTAAKSAPEDCVPGARRVFVAHGGSEQIFDQIREVVAFGEFEAVAAGAPAASTGPDPQGIAKAMRTCGAAVLHAGAGGLLGVGDGGEARRVNEDSLIQIGAAMVHCRRNVVLVVEDAVELPPGLQGLRECRFTGREMDGQSVMALLRAFREFDFG